MRSPSLNRRITAIVAAVLIGIWLAIVTSFYLGNDWADEGVWPRAERVAAIVSLLETTPPTERPLLLAALQSQTLALQIIQRDGENQADPAAKRTDEALIKRYGDRLPGRAVTAALLPSDTEDPSGPKPFGRLLGFHALQELELRIGMQNGETLIVRSASPIPVTRFGLPTGMGAGIIGSLIALGALSILLRELRPLRELANAVDQIDLDGRAAKLPHVRGQTKEIQSLVTAFERLQARLSQLLAGRMAMLGGISHDLRTFATRLRLRIDFIDDEQQRERATKDITDMISLLDDALLATRVGSGDLTEELLDVAAIVRAEVNDLRHADANVFFADKGLQARAMVLGDRIALRRIVTNLIDNALKYGNLAHVRLEVSTRSICLIVEDEGPGIPAENLAIVTEPFVRGEASRSRDTGGSGLGLAVVRNLVEANHGTLRLVNRDTGGLQAVVDLPRYEI